MLNYYEVLNISRQATHKEIVSAFKTLAKEYHPDINKAEYASARFILIYEAYDILKDNKKKILYDILLEEFLLERSDIVIQPSVNLKTKYQEYDNWRSAARKGAESFTKTTYKAFNFSLNFTSKLINAFVLMIVTVLLNSIEIIIVIGLISIAILNLSGLTFYALHGIIILGILIFYYKENGTGSLVKFLIEGMKLKRNRTIIYILITVYLFIIVPASINESAKLAQDKVLDIAKQNAELTNLIDIYCYNYRDSSFQSLYIKKGIVIVDMSTRKIDYLHNNLPNNVITYSPPTVKTLVRIRRETEVLNNHNSTRYSRNIINYEIIDFVSKRKVYSGILYSVESHRSSFQNVDGQLRELILNNYR
jgi:hypothetical protein